MLLSNDRNDKTENLYTTSFKLAAFAVDLVVSGTGQNSLGVLQRLSLRGAGLTGGLWWSCGL